MRQYKTSEAAGCSKESNCEAAKLLALCADQIGAAVSEALREINGLTRAVLDSARYGCAIQAEIGETNALPDRIKADAEALGEAVRNANTRLQFSDRLEQRLSNVSRNLVGLARLIQKTNCPIADAEWNEYLDVTRDTFTMEQEREMFDAIFGGPEARAGTAPSKGGAHGPILFDEEATSEE